MSFLDIAKDKLSSDIFNSSGRFRKDRLEEIKNVLYRMVTPGQVHNLYLVGSMAGYQYNDKSDIDITVILADGADRDYFHGRKKKVPVVFLSGTEHEITFFFQKYNPDISFADAAYAVYNLNEDDFEVDPKKVTYDPKEKFKEQLWFAGKILEKIERLAKEYLKDKLELNDLSVKSSEYKAKIKEIRDDKEKLVGWYRQLDRDRKMAYFGGFGIPRNSQQNITYKLVEHSKYEPLFKKLEKEFGDEVTNLL